MGRTSPTTSPTLRTVGPPQGDRAPLLAEGDRPEGRYRIVRLIARGGMGEVYEAEDEVLHERVALKTLRAAAVGDLAALERFKREIQLARRVTHPNVCRLFEVGFHRPAGAEEDTLFLTMELLEGEPLADWIFREGPAPPEVALPIAQQIAAGLGAAHAAGVIHRDLKSHNVMLVPGKGGLRAVVTDFGLARAADTQTLAGEAPLVGSPAYMAPEQVAREEVGPAADIYSFGVVLYEMVTGHWPFEHNDPIALARMRLEQAPPSPRVHVPGLDTQWEAVILRCLQRDPGARPASAGEVVAALVPQVPIEELELLPEPAPARGRGRRRGVAAGLVAALLAGLATIPLWRREVAVPVIAVLPPRTAPGVPDWQAHALAEALALVLATDAGLRVVPFDETQRLVHDLGVPAAESYAADTLDRVRKRSGATLVVGGLLAPDGAGGTRAALVLQDTAGSRVVRAEAAAPGPRPALTTLAHGAGTAVASALGRPVPAEGALAGVLPERPEAAAAFVSGRVALARFDVAGARGLLERAASMEPGFARVHVALADLWLALRAPDRARGAAERAHALGRGLPPGERVAAEARWHLLSGRPAEAAQRLRVEFRERPHLEAGLALARAEALAGRPVEARAVLDALRALPEPAPTSPLIALAEAELALASDFERARETATRAVSAAEARGTRDILAQALLVRAQASWMLSELEDAVRGAERARALHAALGDRARLADDLNVLLAARWQQGKLAPAAAFAREAAALFEELGITQQAAVNLANLGFVLVRRGDLEGARSSLAEAAALSLPGDPWQGVPALGAAWIDDLQGRPGAAAAYEAAARRLKDFPEPFPLAFLKLRAAELAARSGAPDARAALEDALRFASDRGLRSVVAEARLAQAEVQLRAGRAAEAEALAQAVLGDATRMRAVPVQALAHAVRARAHAAQGDGAAAGDAASAAVAALRETDDTLASLEARVHLARVSCGTADTGALAREAAALGLRVLEDAARAACPVSAR